MNAAFFIGPDSPALLKRFLAIILFDYAAFVIFAGFQSNTGSVSGLAYVAILFSTVLECLLVLGLFRRFCMGIWPSARQRFLFFNDKRLSAYLGVKGSPVSWIWTPIMMAVLLVCTLSAIDWMVALSVRDPASHFQNDRALRLHFDTVTYIGLALSALGMVAGVQFVSGAKETVGAHFGVTYLPPDHWLTKKVANIADRLGLPYKPVVGLTSVANAFAVGSYSDAAVIIGQPLLRLLSEAELDAVIGHELGHIQSSDMQRMQFAEGFQRMLGLVVTGVTVALVNALAKQRSHYVLGHSLGAIVRGSLFIATELAVKSLSRSREFVADMAGARASSPEAMIAALERIHGLSTRPTEAEAQYGYLMFNGSHLNLLFSTHPTLEDRVQAVRSFAEKAELEKADAASMAATMLTEQSEAPDRPSRLEAAGRWSRRAIGKLVTRIRALVASISLRKRRWIAPTMGLALVAAATPSVWGYFDLTEAWNRRAATILTTVGSVWGEFEITSKQLMNKVASLMPSQKDRTITVIENEKANLTAKLAAMSTEMAALQEKNRRLGAQANDLVRMREQLGTNQAKVVEIEAALKHQNDQANAAEASYAANLAAKDTTINDLKAELEQLQAEIKDLLADEPSGKDTNQNTASSQTIAALAEKISSRDARISELQRENESLQASARLSVAADTPPPSDASKEAMANEIATRKRQNELDYASIQSLERDNRTLMAKVDDLEHRQTAQPDDALTLKVRQLEQRITYLLGDKQYLMDKVGALEDQAKRRVAVVKDPPLLPAPVNNAIWAAAAIDQKGKIQIVTNQTSKEGAVGLALKACRGDGGSGCTLLQTAFSNFCMAVARSASNPAPRRDNFGTGMGPTLQYADSKALADCEGETHTTCTVRLHQCSPDSLDTTVQ